MTNRVLRFLPFMIVIGLTALAGLAQAADNVRVRFGDHPGFSRVVFDWPEAAAYEVSATGEAIDVTFASAADFDLSAFRTIGARAIQSVEALDDGRTVRLVLKGGSLGKHFKAGGKVVLDVSEKAGSGAAASRVTPKRPATRPQVARTPVPATSVGIGTEGRPASVVP